MRLIFFADPEPGHTKHVFGDWDMHEYLAEDRWAYYWDVILYPSSSQLSVQNVGEIIIYSDDPVPPDTGSIGVTSDPDGAEIFINSADTGFTTPHTFAGQVVGSYDVYVTKTGYVTPATQTKSVTKGSTTSYSFTMSPVSPDTGSIEVTSDPDGAEIFINSVDTGFTTPHTFAGQVLGSYDVYV